MYCAGNPVLYKDPSGHEIVDKDKLGAVGVDTETRGKLDSAGVDYDYDNYGDITVKVTGQEVYYGAAAKAGAGPHFVKGMAKAVFEIVETGEVFSCEYDLNVTKMRGVNISAGISRVNVLVKRKFKSGTSPEKIIEEYSGNFISLNGSKTLLGVVGVEGSVLVTENSGWEGGAIGMNLAIGPFPYSSNFSITKYEPSSEIKKLPNDYFADEKYNVQMDILKGNEASLYGTKTAEKNLIKESIKSKYIKDKAERSKRREYEQKKR